MLNDGWTLLKAFVPKEGGVEGSTVARVRDVQLAKQYCPMLVTLSGRVIEVRAHPEKQYSPILVIPSGIVIEVRDEHQ